MTEVVVLAAGLGKRLSSASPLPKWLTPISPEVCPGTVQLDALAGTDVGRVHVVVSPWAHEVASFVEPWRDRLDIELVVNEHAADRNNWFSLLVGLDSVAAHRPGDVLVFNSDLFAPVAWFEALVAGLRAAHRPAALAIDPARGRTDEAMKVSLDPSGALVTGIGKVGIDEPAGEYVGLAWWSAPAAVEVAGVLRGFLTDAARVDNWYEHGIAEHVAGGAAYEMVATPAGPWVEIDDPADLEAAREIQVAAGRG